MINIIIPAVVSAIVSTLIWIFKDKILYNREQKKFKLKLLHELYKDVMIIGQSSKIVKDNELDAIIYTSAGNLGFNLKTYFPHLFDKDYEAFFTKALDMKYKISLAIINNEVNQDFINVNQQETFKLRQLEKKVYDNIIKEASKNK